MSRILFIVDSQNDFASKNGKLYVPGGEKAMSNLAKWIYANGIPTDDELGIDQIIVTLDTHFPTHLTQPGHWIWRGKDEDYKLPHIVTKEELESGTLYSRMFNKEYLLEYLKNVEALGRNLTIWPEHCIKGTEGAAIHPKVAQAINWWADRTQTHPIYLEKGDDDPMEMYSLVSTLDSDELNNLEFLEHLSQVDELYIAGLAEDFCVKFTVEDLIKSGFFDDKLVFLTDCVAAIDPNYDRATYKDAVDNHGAMEETSLAETWEGYSLTHEGGMIDDLYANDGKICSNFDREDITDELYDKFKSIAEDYELQNFAICQCGEDKFQAFGMIYSGTNGRENSIISTLDKAKELLLKMKDDERVSWANITDMRSDIPDDLYSFAVVYEV